MSPELPFELRGGNDEITALYNRISAQKRIIYLSKVDIMSKSKEYKLLIDAELYSLYYKNEPLNTPIDELWCQRVADIVKELESKDKDILDKALEDAQERVKQLHKESINNVSPKPLLAKTKSNIVKRFINSFFKKKV